MKKLIIFPDTDFARERIPQILNLICPFTEEDGHFTIHIGPRKYRSFEERLGQFSFLFNSFGGFKMVEHIDYHCELQDM